MPYPPPAPTPYGQLSWPCAALPQTISDRTISDSITTPSNWAPPL